MNLEDLQRIERGAKDALALADEALCDVLILGNFGDMYEAAGAVSDMEVALRSIARQTHLLANRGKVIEFPGKKENGV